MYNYWLHLVFATGVASSLWPPNSQVGQVQEGDEGPAGFHQLEERSPRLFLEVGAHHLRGVPSSGRSSEEKTELN